NERTIMSVSLSRNTSLMNSCGPMQSRWLVRPGLSASGQSLFGNLKPSARAGSWRTHLPLGSTKCPCTSKLNSRPSSCAAATSGSSAAAASSANMPPAFPAAAFTSLNASSVLAAPQEETRKLRRLRPARRALRIARSCAVSFAMTFRFDKGIGMNSPLDVLSSLIGRRVSSGSFRYLMTYLPQFHFKYRHTEAFAKRRCRRFAAPLRLLYLRISRSSPRNKNDKNFSCAETRRTYRSHRRCFSGFRGDTDAYGARRNDSVYRCADHPRHGDTDRKWHAAGSRRQNCGRWRFRLSPHTAWRESRRR